MRGELEQRLDPGYYQPIILNFIEYLKKRNDVKELKAFIKKLETGYNNLQNTENGIGFLRTQNIRQIFIDNTETTFTNDNKVRITKEGDLLFTRIGVNVGDVAYNSIGEFAISDNVIKCSLSDNLLAHFVAIYLATERGSLLLKREKRDTARPIISYINIRKLLIPIVNPRLMQDCVNMIIEARKVKEKKEKEAKNLLEKIDDYILSELGIHISNPKINIIENRIFKVSSKEIANNRIDPSFHAKYYKEIEMELSKMNHRRLYSICSFSKETWNLRDYFETTFPYIEISEIDLETGEVLCIKEVSITEAPSRAKMIVRNNDIIISTTRPSRGAISLIKTNNEPLIASTGFSVIRKVDTSVVSKEFLLLMLRCKTSLLQMEKRSSGGNYPAITEDELAKIIIPIPEPQKQLAIFEGVSSMINEAKRIRLEAKFEFEQSKSHIEKLIFS